LLGWDGPFDRVRRRGSYSEQQRRADSGTPLTDIVGITAQHAVIFVNSHPDTLQLPTWVAEFDTGYALGVGVKVPGTFDKFVPVSPSSALLIIDALANIEIVNWT